MAGLTATGALNKAAGTSGLTETGAANAIAETEGLTLTGALNEAAGTSGLTATGAMNALAGTWGLTLTGAANHYADNLDEDPVEPEPVEGFSVFGEEDYPGTLALFTDGTPNIIAANAFYTFGSEVDGWVCVGGRVFVPEGVELPANTTVSMWAYAGEGDGPDLSAEPLATGVIASPAEGWNDVGWDPVEVSAGTPFWIGYDTGDGSYMAATDLGDDFIASADVDLVLSERNMSGLGGRSYFRIGEGSTSSSSSGPGYGVDAIVAAP